MEFDAFGFGISILNFLIMFVLFNQVVIGPMEEAVNLRRKKVATRLDEIGTTLKQARQLESEVQQQFSRLDQEKQEMSQATEREIERVQEKMREQSQRDAEHLVAKTRRECDKVRLDTLAGLSRQLSDRAMDKVETLLVRSLDSQSQQSSARVVLHKAVQQRPKGVQVA